MTAGRAERTELMVRLIDLGFPAGINRAPPPVRLCALVVSGTLKKNLQFVYAGISLRFTSCRQRTLFVTRKTRGVGEDYSRC